MVLLILHVTTTYTTGCFQYIYYEEQAETFKNTTY